MLNTGKFAALAILSILPINPAFADDKSAAMVNGVSIPQARIDLRVKAVTTQGQGTDTPELRKQIRDEMINLEVMAQEALKSGMDKKPEVVQQTELARQSVLVSAFVQDYLNNHPVSEDQIKQEYDQYNKNKLGTQEYNIRHIQVDTEAEAKAIIVQLGKKAKFDKLAKEKSKDAGSSSNGGSLGWNSPGNIPPFADALLKLKKGEYTKEPVQSQIGWHVLKIDDVRGARVSSFEDLKPQIQQRLQQQSIQSMIADLRTKAKIE